MNIDLSRVVKNL